MTGFRVRTALAATILACMLLASGCDEQRKPRSPAEVRAEIHRLLPKGTRDRDGWALDVQSAFAALKIEPTTQNICSALAVTEQESTFTADPEVPGLARIALAEIERRAARLKVPRFVVHAALAIETSTGRTYRERLDAVRTERELSELFEDMIAAIPMGKRLLSNANPVRTGGPMQVSIPFAENYAKKHPYPYPLAGSLRHEVFTRRGGMYFGIAHLLGYPTSYEKPLYRFADFNAGFYASRNAAFQKAVSIATGVPLTLDGDLVDHGERAGSKKASETEAAVRRLAQPLQQTDAEIRRALRQGDSLRFERSDLYQGVFALAEQEAGKPLARAVMPRITLESPKITRKLTTEWFATRVDKRYQRCMSKAGDS